MIDIIETVYRGASKGRGLVVSPKGLPASLPMLTFLTDHYQTIRPVTDTSTRISFLSLYPMYIRSGSGDLSLRNTMQTREIL